MRILVFILFFTSFAKAEVKVAFELELSTIQLARFVPYFHFDKNEVLRRMNLVGHPPPRQFAELSEKRLAELWIELSIPSSSGGFDDLVLPLKDDISDDQKFYLSLTNHSRDEWFLEFRHNSPRTPEQAIRELNWYLEKADIRSDEFSLYLPMEGFTADEKPSRTWGSVHLNFSRGREIPWLSLFNDFLLLKRFSKGIWSDIEGSGRHFEFDTELDLKGLIKVKNIRQGYFELRWHYDQPEQEIREIVELLEMPDDLAFRRIEEMILAEENSLNRGLDKIIELIDSEEIDLQWKRKAHAKSIEMAMDFFPLLKVQAHDVLELGRFYVDEESYFTTYVFPKLRQSKMGKRLSSDPAEAWEQMKELIDEGFPSSYSRLDSQRDRFLYFKFLPESLDISLEYLGANLEGCENNDLCADLLKVLSVVDPREEIRDYAVGALEWIRVSRTVGLWPDYEALDVTALKLTQKYHHHWIVRRDAKDRLIELGDCGVSLETIE